jgi:peptidoglycan/LPS O-acetylase OafA/YrhL
MAALIAAYMVLGPEESGPAFRWVGMPLAVLGTVVIIRHGYEQRAGPIVAVLSCRPAAWLGERSYSLYLWNGVPVYLLDKDVIPLPVPLVGLLGVASTLVATVVSFRLLEKPFMRSRADALSRRRATVVAD